VRVLAVDPGREKCGVAVCGPNRILARQVVGVGDLGDLVHRWLEAYGVEVLIVGDQTGSKRVFDILGDLNLPVRRVTERGTTLTARRRYFQDHPRSGWRRLLPISLQVPPEPYDDYAAVVLAEAYLDAWGSRSPAEDA
jgi:RNase H-fold protein (predicted Holliday junction resolvase)